MTLTNVEHESGPTLSRRRLIQLGAAGLLGTEFAVSRAAAEGPPCIGCNGQVVGSGYLLSTDGALPCLVDASWTSPGLVHFFDESGRISKSLNVPAGAYGSAAGGGLFRVGARAMVLEALDHAQQDHGTHDHEHGIERTTKGDRMVSQYHHGLVQQCTHGNDPVRVWLGPLGTR